LNNYPFEQSFITVNIYNSDVTEQNFVSPAFLSSISGRITNDDSTALPGVTVVLSDAISTTTIIDAYADYTYTGVRADHSYKITP
jgi:hypothetical protein